ncbi:MAG: SRPBCC domain-containing protein [Planctomycetota bacterium]
MPALHRTVLVAAPTRLVFRFLSESEFFSRWWGPGSEIDAKVGGVVHIVHPGGNVAGGTVTSIEAPTRIEFTYGYERETAGLAVGDSNVVITLREVTEGTELTLEHRTPDEASTRAHVAGWRYQLAVLAGAAADFAHREVTSVADDWFDAWNTKDAAPRTKLLARCTSDQVQFRDRYSCGSGRDELVEHIGQAQQHMPGLTIARDGDVRHCQGTAMVGWTVTSPDGAIVARGTDIYRLAPDGRIADSVGLWSS